jgi:Replication protein
MIQARPDGSPARASGPGPSPEAKRGDRAPSPAALSLDAPAKRVIHSPETAAAQRPPREVAKQRGPEADYGEHRRALWACLRVLWRYSTIPRQRYCRRFPAAVRKPGGAIETAQIVVEKRGDRANYSGLQTCGNPGCPQCGPKIAVERAADIALALTEHYSRGGRVILASLTAPHTRVQRLTDLLDGLGKAWASIRQNKVPRRLLKAHTVGWIKRLEVTTGPNGWHPHLHALIFVDADTTDDQAAQLMASMYATWIARLKRLGLATDDQDDDLAAHALDWKILDLGQAHENVADYVAKTAALELASAGTKRARRARNRTPVQLLHDVSRYGDAEDLAKWWEYEQAMRRKPHLLWSDGLRARLLGEQLPEVSDEEAAERNDGLGRLIGIIGDPTWRRICSWVHGPATVLSWAEVYDDDDQARELINRKLAQHGLGQLEAGSFNPPAHHGVRNPGRGP